MAPDRNVSYTWRDVRAWPRRLRALATSPTKPEPIRNIDAGSGTTPAVGGVVMGGTVPEKDPP